MIKACLTRPLLQLGLLALTLSSPTSALPSPVTLDGSHLTLEQVQAIARDGAPVQLETSRLEMVERAHQLVLVAADADVPIYGLNRGVGLNKDKTLFSGDVADPEAKAASQKFNRDMLRAHSAGVGPDAPDDVVRAAMAVRLNTAMIGHSGAQREVVEMYRDFLNRGIHPIVPSRGSLGEADITLLSHVGLAMMGEGDVRVEGRRMPAAQALRQAGLRPLQPFAKDGLAIISSNAFSVGWACLVIGDIERTLDASEQIYALSLEGFDGNVAPLLETVQNLRPYPGQRESAERVRSLLAGSYLWGSPGSPGSSRQLQDPLSYRCFSQVNGAARDILSELTQQLALQLNSSDDNPAVILDAQPPADAPDQVKAYYVSGGAVIPTANFEPLSWVLSLENLGIGLAHISSASSERMTRLGDDHFTQLTRFLAPDPQTLAFSAIQKAYVSLDSENRALAMPTSLNYLNVAGGIEDVATNSLLTVHRLERLNENLRCILGMELLHAAQAVDLRRRKDPALKLGTGTEVLLATYRRVVPFLDRDRPLTPDIQSSDSFVDSLAR